MSRGLFLIADHQKKHAIKLAQELITAILFACALQFAHLPAAWFFGPLVASAFFALRDWQAVELPRTVYVAAQAVIGCALGAGFSPATLLTLPKHFAIFAFAVVFILLTSLLNGWLLTRRTRLDVATAFLGTMPGRCGRNGGHGRQPSGRFPTGGNHAVREAPADSGLARPGDSFSQSSLLSAPGPGGSYHRRAPGDLRLVEDWSSCLLAFIGWLTGMRTRIPAGTFLVPTVLYLAL